MKAIRLITLSVIMISFFLSPHAVQAKEWIKQGEETFILWGGAFFPAFNTNLRVDNKDLGRGSNINLEDDLKFTTTETTFYAGVLWRFASRHSITASYFQFSRDSSATLAEQIQIGDEIYPVGAGIETDFTFRVIPITYRYSFLKKEKYELSGSIGVHWYKMEFKIKGNASLGAQDLDAETSASADAPLPLIGLKFNYYISPRWTASGHMEAFYLTGATDDFSLSGGLYNFKLSTEYWIFNNVGVGAAVNYFILQVDIEEDTWKGEFNYNYWGPQVYLLVRF